MSKQKVQHNYTITYFSYNNREKLKAKLYMMILDPQKQLHTQTI